MKKTDMVYVEIVKEGHDGQLEEVVKRMGPMERGRAEHVENGANINLGHDDYFTRIVEAEGI